jgi:Na+-driven multidrug efflux pump
MGQHELAISNITRSAYMVATTPFWGVMVATNSMTSNLIGQNRAAEVTLLLNRIIRLSTALAILFFTIMLLLPDQLMRLFTNDPSLISDSRGPLFVVSLATLVFPFAISSISAVSGTGATRTALYIEIGAIILYMFYLWLIVFYFQASLEWAWGSELLYWIFTGIVSWVYIKKGRWKRIKI